MNETDVQRNLRLLQIFRGLGAALIVMPVIVPFFQSNGLSQTEIFLLQSAFAAIILLLEIPSGYFADRFGRKLSLLMGAILTTVGFVAYGLAFGFWPMLVAELILGVGMSFISGADSALAYDSLLSAKREKEYRKFEAMTFTYSAIGGVAAAIAGGLIATSSLRAAVLAQVAVNLLLIPAALLLKEPKRHETRAGRNVLRDVLQVTRYALHGHQEIKWLIFYAAVIGTLTHTVIWLTQPYYQQAAIPIGWFGLLWGAQLIATALCARLADRYEAFGRRRVLTSFIVIGVLSYALLGSAIVVWLLPVIVGFSFIRGVATPIIRDYVNRLVESGVRATVLSVQSLAQRVLYIGAGPLIGWVMDIYSLQMALLFSSLFYGTLGMITLLMMQRAKLL